MNDETGHVIKCTLCASLFNALFAKLIIGKSITLCSACARDRNTYRINFPLDKQLTVVPSK